MYRLGSGGAMAARAVQVIRDDPDFDEVLVEERGGGLVFYERVEPFGRAPWEAYYLRWARIVPLTPSRSQFRLEYMRYTDKWQALPLTGTLEECVEEIRADSFQLFFGGRAPRKGSGGGTPPPIPADEG